MHNNGQLGDTAKRQRKSEPALEDLRAEFASMPDDAYCSDRYAAAYLGTSRPVLANLRSQKRGPPFVRMGKRLVRYKVGSLRQHMADRVKQTAD
jgi:predicted DNA-binding transcriptional regulator AlpA